MKRILLPLTCAALALGACAEAQTAQDELDSRYDRALAAGYKALFLCGAIANAERAGATRDPEHIHEWELTGIQEPLDEIIREMPYEIVRHAQGSPGGTPAQISHVSVEWADDMPPRIARHNSQQGCSTMPIGWTPPPEVTLREQRPITLTEVPQLQDGALADAVRAAFDQEGPRTTAVVVLKDGAIIAERYANGFGPNVPQRTWSVAKSIAATVVGAAVYRGDASIDDSAGLGLGPQDAMRRAVTIDHALRMATGRYSDTPGNRTNPLYWGGTTVDERAANWPQVHQPGTVFRYANNDTLAAVQAIEGTFEEHPPEDFFRKLGMNHTVAERDWQGNYVLSSQVWSTARDLAKLGQLHLDDGVLPNGERILPEGWGDYVSQTSGPQPDRVWGYGASWWTFKHPEKEGHRGVPDDAYTARGNRGQYVVVVPSRKVVIVRRGEDPAGEGFDLALLTREVLAALD